MHAADGGHGQTARTLLEAGAHPDVISFEGYTAADLAAIQSHLALQVNNCRRCRRITWTTHRKVEIAVFGPRWPSIFSFPLRCDALGATIATFAYSPKKNDPL